MTLIDLGIPQYNHVFVKSKSLRRLLWDHGQRECGWCGVKFTKLKRATLDHVIPQSRGGKSIYVNCVLACKRCNGLKGDMMPVQFMRKLASMGINYGASQ